MLDLPDKSVIVGGLDFWTYPSGDPQMIQEPRLAAKIGRQLGRPVKLRLPPSAPKGPDGRPTCGIPAYEFPRWFIAQESRVESRDSTEAGYTKRRLLSLYQLSKGKWIDPDGESRDVVPVRFVAVCPNGHVADIDWKWFIHRGDRTCAGELHLEERGTSGHLSEVVAACSCGKRRRLSEAYAKERAALGKCFGNRPWLGADSQEDCDQTPRLLVRTASNAYFPQVLSAISIPNRYTDRDEHVRPHAERLGAKVDKPEMLEAMLEMLPSDDPIRSLSVGEVQASLRRIASGAPPVLPSVKAAEFEALSESGERLGDDKPGSQFFARVWPKARWSDPIMAGIRRVLLVERLCEVSALLGFTRLEPISPRIDGDPGDDGSLQVKRAAIALDRDWVPAIENRGEGVFLEFDASIIASWLAEQSVADRVDELVRGFERWREDHPGTSRSFAGGPYVMLHTFSHLLLTAMSLDCGYPASSLRERIYALPGEGGNVATGRYGVLIYTGSSDAEGTLGGLIRAGTEIVRHVRRALDIGMLCSHDPVCAGHSADSPTGRPLQGAACHGCCLIAETSCEQHNEFLDRSLVTSTVSGTDCGFFGFAARQAR